MARGWFRPATWVRRTRTALRSGPPGAGAGAGAGGCVRRVVAGARRDAGVFTGVGAGAAVGGGSVPAATVEAELEVVVPPATRSRWWGGPPHAAATRLRATRATTCLRTRPRYRSCGRL